MGDKDFRYFFSPLIGIESEYSRLPIVYRIQLSKFKSRRTPVPFENNIGVAPIPLYCNVV